jgi:hypothetical protein
MYRAAVSSLVGSMPKKARHAVAPAGLTAISTCWRQASMMSSISMPVAKRFLPVR